MAEHDAFENTCIAVEGRMPSSNWAYEDTNVRVMRDGVGFPLIEDGTVVALTIHRTGEHKQGVDSVR